MTLNLHTATIRGCQCSRSWIMSHYWSVTRFARESMPFMDTMSVSQGSNFTKLTSILSWCSLLPHQHCDHRYEEREYLATRGGREHNSFQSSAHLFLNSTSYLSRAGPRACCLKKRFKTGNIQNRIPTVKLKIPKKAFLKSESRTSVLFKLWFLTLAKYKKCFHNLFVVADLL